MHRLAVVVVPAVLAALTTLTACGDDGGGSGPQMVGPCGGTLEQLPSEPGTHMPVGADIEWSSNPPVIGAHFPVWAGWDRHYPQLDRGYYVHNLEHGGIVLLYNCPNGCPDVVQDLIGVVAATAKDDSCDIPITNRMLVVSDPLMPAEVQVAAVAWGQKYTASCFDPYVTTFVRAHYRHGTEDTCADGVGTGGTPIQFPTP